MKLTWNKPKDDVFDYARKRLLRVYKKFGKELTRLRQNKKISISELAERANVSTEVIEKLEQGNEPSTSLILTLSNILDSDLGTLLEDLYRQGMDI